MSDGNGTSLNSNLTSAEQNWTTTLSATHAINTIILCSTIYLLACVILHGNKHRMWSLKTQRGKLYIACAATVGSAVPRLVLDQIYYHLADIEGALENCELLTDLSNASCSIAMLATYAFLWMRQWVIHSNETIRRISSKWIRILSRASLGMILMTGVVFLCVFTIPQSYESTGKYCVSIELDDLPTHTKSQPLRSNYILGGLLLLIQISVLFLFIYPMAKTRANVPTNHEHKTDLITATMRRNLIGVIVAVTSDCVTLMLLSITPWRAPLLITDIIYNATIFVNSCSIICTFRSPADILLPCCKNLKSPSAYSVENLTRDAGTA